LRIKFSLQSKDAMYKNLLVQIKNAGTKYPRDDSREMREFEQECLDMEREYKGEYLSCHHPDEPNAHDDYPDSWALAEWAHRQLLENEPDLDVVETARAHRNRAEFLIKHGSTVKDEDDDDLVA